MASISVVDVQLRVKASLVAERQPTLYRTKLVLQNWLSHVQPAGTEESPLDPFDPSVRSQKTLDQLWRRASEISRRWRIASRLQVDDFTEALEEALESGT